MIVENCLNGLTSDLSNAHGETGAIHVLGARLFFVFKLTCEFIEKGAGALNFRDVFQIYPDDHGGPTVQDELYALDLLRFIVGLIQCNRIDSRPRPTSGTFAIGVVSVMISFPR